MCQSRARTWLSSACHVTALVRHVSGMCPSSARHVSPKREYYSLYSFPSYTLGVSGICPEIVRVWCKILSGILSGIVSGIFQKLPNTSFKNAVFAVRDSVRKSVRDLVRVLSGFSQHLRIFASLCVFLHIADITSPRELSLFLYILSLLIY